MDIGDQTRNLVVAMDQRTRGLHKRQMKMQPRVLFYPLVTRVRCRGNTGAETRKDQNGPRTCYAMLRESV